MSGLDRYNLDLGALLYEDVKESRGHHAVRIAVFLAAGLLATLFYMWLWTSVFGLDLPKMAILKARNAAWQSKVELLERDMDVCEEALDGLDMRDENIYRSIFGMNPIPSDVLGPVDAASRYAFLDAAPTLKDAYARLDGLAGRTYVESRSYDEISGMSKKAGDMASCIPAIPPVNPDKRFYNLSSPFGTRIDPVYGGLRTHTGVDFAAKVGTPIYATGDGVIESVDFLFYGYGNTVVIDHGFGYKTMYAHMSTVNVVEGMHIKRGECIGGVGKSGKTTGAHLHYEVIYRGNKVNPANFYDLDMSPKEYSTMVRQKEEESPAVLRSSFRLRTR